MPFVCKQGQLHINTGGPFDGSLVHCYGNTLTILILYTHLPREKTGLHKGYGFRPLKSIGRHGHFLNLTRRQGLLTFDMVI